MADHLPRGAVQMALEQQLFGRFTVRENTISVGIVPQVLLKSSPERIGYVLTNTGNIQVTMTLARDVVVGVGLIIAQQGDTMSTTFIEDGQFPTFELSAIGSGAGAQLYIIEFIRVGV
mgnify:CR=1 FL=1